MMNRKTIPLFLAVAGSALLAGCGSARKSEPFAAPLPLSAQEVESGKVAFMKHCNQCHVRGEAGLGPAINDKPLPDFVIRTQVRQGLGAMPAFGKHEIGSRELEQILAYLKALRDQESPATDKARAG